MRFSFYELWIVTGEETTWSWSCSFVQTSEMKSYWVERWWKRRLNHQLVGYLWPTPAAVSLTLQEPKVCQKNVPPHWKILFKRKFFKTFCTQQFSTPFSFDTKLGKKVQDHTVLKVHFCPKTQFLSNHSQPNLIITFSWFFKGGKQILTEKFNKNQIECLDSKWHFDTLWWYCQGLLVKVMSTQ